MGPIGSLQCKPATRVSSRIHCKPATRSPCTAPHLRPRVAQQHLLALGQRPQRHQLERLLGLRPLGGSIRVFKKQPWVFVSSRCDTSELERAPCTRGCTASLPRPPCGGHYCRCRPAACPGPLQPTPPAESQRWPRPSAVRGRRGRGARGPRPRQRAVLPRGWLRGVSALNSSGCDAHARHARRRRRASRRVCSTEDCARGGSRGVRGG
jgi:hypothetical protein